MLLRRLRNLAELLRVDRKMPRRQKGQNRFQNNHRRHEKQNTRVFTGASC